ncbi:hypothetical protein ACHQM5_010308 [Ranunculus cassubicifolius]
MSPNQDPSKTPNTISLDSFPIIHSSAKDFFSKFIKSLLFIFFVASISLVFFSAFSTQSRWLRCPVCLTRNEYPEETQEPHRLPPPLSNETNLSHIVFGIGGSGTTWKDRRHYSQLWWKPNQTRGFVWLDHKPINYNDEDEDNTCPPYRVSEPTSRFTNGLRPAIRISRIVVESFRLGLPNVRWFVMGDDDTVFFPDNLVTLLSRYDHNQMYYIGGNSESVEQNVMHSYDMAFGGGGFAISYPLAAQLNKVLDGCIQRYWDLYGSDQRIESCLSEIGVSMTRNRGFHQFDIRGNPYGLLAAHPLTPLITLHHLDAVSPLIPNNTQMESLGLLFEAYKVDPARIIQQSFCHDLVRNWSLSVSWGYTVQLYPSLLRAKVLNTALDTFKTWRSWKNGPFTFNTRPISSDPCERPLIFFFDRIDDLGKLSVGFYKRFVGETGYDCDRAPRAINRVIVSAPKMDPNEWKKAPRRQCCQVVNRLDGAVHVRIRHCKPGESVSTLP